MVIIIIHAKEGFVVVIVVMLSAVSYHIIHAEEGFVVVIVVMLGGVVLHHTR